MRIIASVRVTALVVQLAGTGWLYAQVPLPTGHADAGAAVYMMKCVKCHQLGPDAKNGDGPMLNGVLGRMAGTYSGFAYSDAIKTSGLVWDEATLAKFLAAPKTVVSNGTMGLALAQPQDVADVIAYLKEFDANGKSAQ